MPSTNLISTSKSNDFVTLNKFLKYTHAIKNDNMIIKMIMVRKEFYISF